MSEMRVRPAVEEAVHVRFRRWRHGRRSGVHQRAQFVRQVRSRRAAFALSEAGREGLKALAAGTRKPLRMVDYFRRADAAQIFYRPIGRMLL
jgi:hypothetical protein